MILSARRFWKRWLPVVVLLITTAPVCTAQQYYTVIQTSQSGNEQLPVLPLRRIPLDSIAAIQQLQSVLRYLHRQAFITASVDSLQWKPDTLRAYLTAGPQFRWVTLRPGNLDEQLLSEVGYREKMYRDRVFSEQELSRLEERILNYADNHGYPFASIRLDSVTIEHNSIRASLHLDKGPFIKFDTIAVIGTARIKPEFLASYLRLESGQPFSQRKIDRANRMLMQLPYFMLSQPATVAFKNDRAYPVFYLDAKPSNEIDGIIGLLPNETGKNKVLITGELRLNLMNMFSSGKNFSLHWQQVRPASPRLEIAYTHPALLKTPLEMSVDFRLLKEDSTFITINRRLTLMHQLGSLGKVKATTGMATSQLGSNARYRTSVQLPEFSDSRWISYGLGYIWSNVDDYFYPSRGTDASAEVLLGNKKVLKNPFVEPKLYDSIPLNNAQVALSGSFRRFTRISSRSTVLTQITGGKMISEVLFMNDLFRLGGLNSLRGYNENFYYAHEYGVATLEYRFSLDNSSQFFFFYDQAYVRYALHNKINTDVPLGTGLGVNLRTNAGVFTFVYALAQAKERKFGLHHSRIHFGYTSRF